MILKDMAEACYSCGSGDELKLKFSEDLTVSILHKMTLSTQPVFKMTLIYKDLLHTRS